MKKLIILCLIIEIINLLLTVVSKYGVESFTSSTIADSVINKIRIDSIELVINKKDSIILKIKEHELEEIKQADSLNNDDAVILFKRLVSK